MNQRDEPKVSIGLPVFNGEKWLGDTLDNLLSQTYSNLEVIISDNASTDATQNISNAFVSMDKRVRLLVNRENMGLANNYNKAFNCSSGVYFKWSTASDVCDKDFIRKCVEVLNKRTDVVLCYPRTKLFVDSPEQGEEYSDNLNLQQEKASERFIELLLNMRLNNAMNGVIRSNVLRQTILHKAFLGSDICLMAELVLRGKMYELPETLFYRRMDRETATKLKTRTEVKQYFRPRNSELMLFQSWKSILNLFSVVQRAPITILEKMEAYQYLLKRMYWGKNDLFEDIREAIDVIFARMSTDRKP